MVEAKSIPSKSSLPNSLLMRHPFYVFGDDGQDGQRVAAHRLRIVPRDRLEERAVQREGAGREVGAVEGLRPEGGEGLADLRQELAEQRVAAGIVDREME